MEIAQTMKQQTHQPIFHNMHEPIVAVSGVSGSQKTSSLHVPYARNDFGNVFVTLSLDKSKNIRLIYFQ